MAGLTRANALREALAGISLIAISVPLNIGYAQIAGLPPTAGLYALIVPTVLYVLLTSSRQLVVSPDAAASALVFSSLVALGASEGNVAAMAAAQAILGGLLLVLAAVLRLGFLATFLSHPILVGYVAGLALEILLSQAAKMMGIRLPAGGDFFADVAHLVTELPQANPWSLALSVPAVILLAFGRRLPVVPWALVVIVAATLLADLLDLQARGVAVLGPVPAGPPVFGFPVLELSTWARLVPSALALAMVAMAETLLMSRSYAERNGYRVLPNQDVLALGVSNIAAGTSSSYSVGASASRTAAMDDAGSRTQLPGIVLAVGALLLVWFGTGLLEDIPSPAIGAVVAVAVWGLLGIPQFRRLWRTSRAEFSVAVACLLGVLIVGPLGGILIAFVLSLVNLARRAANPPIDVLVGEEDPHVSLTEAAPPGTQTAPGILVIRFAAPLFFANGNRLVERVQEAVEEAPEPTRAVVLDLEGVTDIDVTGAGRLARLRDWLHQRDITLSYTRVRREITGLLVHHGLQADTDAYPTNRAAVAAITATLAEDNRP